MPQRSGKEKETGKEKKESRVFFVRARSGVLPSSVCPEPVLANDRVCVFAMKTQTISRALLFSQGGLDGAWQCLRTGEHPGWWRVRPGVASGRAAREAQQGVRRLYRCGRGSNPAWSLHLSAARLPRRVQRWPACWQHAHDATRPLWRDRVPGTYPLDILVRYCSPRALLSC
jgi:hypothetical protein